MRIERPVWVATLEANTRFDTDPLLNQPQGLASGGGREPGFEMIVCGALG